MLTLIYDPNSDRAIPDGKVGYTCQFIAMEARAAFEQNADWHYTFSTENIFTAVRLAIVQGLIHHHSVQFAYEDKVFMANEYGAISKWPDGFCDQTVKMATEIARTANRKLTQQRERDRQEMLDDKPR